LFEDGLRILNLIPLYEAEMKDQSELSSDQRESIGRALKVLQTIVNTAGITAPCDLWLLRQIISSYTELGLNDVLSSRHWKEINAVAQEYKLNLEQFQIDLNFFHSRGLIHLNEGRLKCSDLPQAQDIMQSRTALLPDTKGDWVGGTAAVLSGKSVSENDLKSCQVFYSLDCSVSEKLGWVPSFYEIEVGYRLVPLVLALRSLDLTLKLQHKVQIRKLCPPITEEMLHLLRFAGMLEFDDQVSLLGERVFTRGPGPFGIIHAYHSRVIKFLNRV